MCFVQVIQNGIASVLVVLLPLAVAESATKKSLTTCLEYTTVSGSYNQKRTRDIKNMVRRLSCLTRV